LGNGLKTPGGRENGKGNLSLGRLGGGGREQLAGHAKRDPINVDGMKGTSWGGLGGKELVGEGREFRGVTVLLL